MGTNCLLFGWNRSIPGREGESSAHFDEFSGYLAQLQAGGGIDSFEVFFLDPHGGDLNGFFLIRADTARLDALMASDAWVRHMFRGQLHLEGQGVIRGASGAEVMSRMEIWRSLLPK